MLLKKIVIENFRQFIGQQELVFSTEIDKNVTVIMGENGSGKTSLAQTFIWCLYGETDFIDKSLLNKIIAGRMTLDSKEEVRVDLYLTHNGTEYILTRKQDYRKDFKGILKLNEI